jgi:hypothetical protein
LEEDEKKSDAMSLSSKLKGFSMQQFSGINDGDNYDGDDEAKKQSGG